MPATHSGMTGARRRRGSDCERSSVAREGGSGTSSTSTDETPLSNRLNGLSVGEVGKKRRGEDKEGNREEEDDEVVAMVSRRRCSTEYLMM